MELYLIRHAQSENNARPVEQRVEDPGLTEVGHRQAGLLGEWVKGLNLDRIITSPFLRSLLTAEYMAHATELRPEVRICLHELGGCVRGVTPEDMVGAPGMTRYEIQQRFPGFEIEADIAGQGWWREQPYETEDAARERARRLIDSTRREFGPLNQRVAYVMHADFKLLLLAHFHTEPLEVPFNTSVTRVVITPSSSVLEDYNRVDHLPRELVTR